MVKNGFSIWRMARLDFFDLSITYLRVIWVAHREVCHSGEVLLNALLTRLVQRVLVAAFKIVRVCVVFRCICSTWVIRGTLCVTNHVFFCTLRYICKVRKTYCYALCVLRAIEYRVVVAILEDCEAVCVL